MANQLIAEARELEAEAETNLRATGSASRGKSSLISKPGPAGAEIRPTSEPHPCRRHRARRSAARRSRPGAVAESTTTYKLRHTFASTLIACGEDPASVMAQLGHTDPKFTLRVYTHMMRRGPDERARLKALVRGAELPS